MTNKFGYISKARVKPDVTAKYTINQISVNGVSPVLIVSPAAEINKGYFNALFKRSKVTAQRVKANQITADTISENRAEDRELYSKYIIRGWEDLKDENGKDIPFTQEDCFDFLCALDDYIVDELRAYCGKVENFTDTINFEVAEDVGKN